MSLRWSGLLIEEGLHGWAANPISQTSKVLLVIVAWVSLWIARNKAIFENFVISLVICAALSDVRILSTYPQESQKMKGRGLLLKKNWIEIPREHISNFMIMFI